MSLERFHPLQELETMKREMDRIWQDVFSAPAPAPAPSKKRTEREEGTATPAIDIIDSEGEVIVKAEMPGVKKEDLSVSIEQDTLYIKGEVKDEAPGEGQRHTYSERKYTGFSRSINLPLKIEVEKIKASLKDGLLSIHLPKAVKEQPRKITIDVSE
ncbi:MAG: Hsp20/alpha crystallin family protein [Thermodesulfobacteriota bacterium]